MSRYTCHTIHREDGRLVVRESGAESKIVCTLHGDPDDEGTQYQANAICIMLDRIARRAEPAEHVA